MATKKLNSYDALFPGRFLKAGLFDGKERTLTIVDVIQDTLDGEKGPEPASILMFSETPLQLKLNRTNAECLRNMFGKKVRQDWIGKRVTFMPDTDKFGSDMVDCIRIAGSPDIKEAFDASIQLRSKGGKIRIKKRTLRVTAAPMIAGAVAPAATPPDNQPPPNPDDDGRAE